MNVAIIGKSSFNTKLKKYLAAGGFVPLMFEDFRDVREIDGEIGRFTLKTVKSGLRSVEVGFAVVAEDLFSHGAENRIENETKHGTENGTGKGNGFKGIPLLSLTEPGCLERISRGNGPVVFVLDFPQESPGDMTELALESAVRLTGKKRKVIYAARFARTAGPGIEKLYREARKCGVVFYRYRNIAVKFDEEGFYHIEASDEFGGKLQVDTSTVISAYEAEDDGKADKIADILKIRKETFKASRQGKFFMFPVLTGRKGIYSLSGIPDTGREDRWKPRLEFILRDMQKETGFPARFETLCAKGLSFPLNTSGDLSFSPGAFVRIDAAKCAFCYTCFRTCPHSAMVPDDEKPVMKNLESACSGCGICVSVCPAGAVEPAAREQAAGRPDAGGPDTREQAARGLSAMRPDIGRPDAGGLTTRGWNDRLALACNFVPAGGCEPLGKYARTDCLTAGEVNSAGKEAPNSRLTVLCCENSAGIAAEVLRKEADPLLDRVFIEAVSCGGELSVERILSVLKYSDRVLVAVCSDDACRHFEGNIRARRFVEKARQMLKDSGLDENRAAYAGLSWTMTGVLRDYLVDSGKKTNTGVNGCDRR